MCCDVQGMMCNNVCAVWKTKIKACVFCEVPDDVLDAKTDFKLHLGFLELVGGSVSKMNTKVWCGCCYCCILFCSAPDFVSSSSVFAFLLLQCLKCRREFAAVFCVCICQAMANGWAWFIDALNFGENKTRFVGNT